MKTYNYESIPLHEQVVRASRLAKVAHAGQKDKAGVSYINHPAAVARLLFFVPEFHALSAEDQVCAEIAAWLHDVIEDSPINDFLLSDLGFPSEAVVAVQRLTFVPTAQTRGDYYKGISRHPIAQAVKVADIAHNTHPLRLAKLEPSEQNRLRSKYRYALAAIGIEREEAIPDLANIT